MTEDTMTFVDQIQKLGGDFMKDLVEAVLQRLMEIDVEGRIGADARTSARPSATAFANAATTHGWARSN
jgi:hypothetical protein